MTTPHACGVGNGIQCLGAYGIPTMKEIVTMIHTPRGNALAAIHLPLTRQLDARKELMDT